MRTGGLKGALSLRLATIPIAALLLAMTLALTGSSSGTHDATVSMVPVNTKAGVDIGYTLTVANASGDNIEWWNSNWSYRRQIQFSGSYPDNYQFKLVLKYSDNLENNSQSDFDDLRVVEGENTVLPIWRENYILSENVTLWFIHLDNDLPCYLYYGNPDTVGIDSADSVFIFYDDFDYVDNAYKYKYSDNPILTYGEQGDFENWAVREPTVLYDGTEENENRKWKMWYGSTMIQSHGHGTISLAWSNDGLTWTKYPNNPVLEPASGSAWDDKSVECPYVMRLENGIYLLYYRGNGTYAQIGLATSVDKGITWTRYENNPVMTWQELSNSDTQPEGGFGPSVLQKSSDNWFMYYGGDADHINKLEGFLGTASSYKGPFYFYKKVISAETDAERAQEPSVIKIDNIYYYAGPRWQSWGNDFYCWLWTSTNGENFTAWSGNPYISPNGTEWDSKQIHFPALLWKENTMYTYYSGADVTSTDSAQFKIGVFIDNNFMSSGSTENIESKWTDLSGGTAIATGEDNRLKLKGDGSNRSYVASNIQVGKNISITLKYSGESATGSSLITAMHWDKTKKGTGSPYYNKPDNSFHVDWFGDFSLFKLVSGTETHVSLISGDPFPDTAWHTLEFRYFDNNLKTYYDGALKNDNVDGQSFSYTYIGLASNEIAYSTYVDNIIVRKYFSPEPTVSLGIQTFAGWQLIETWTGTIEAPPPWAGTAVFSLANLYTVNVEKILDLNEGSKLVLKFYTYADAFESENVIENFSPPWHVEESESVPHPQAVAVEKARLDLTTDNTENVISTIASFIVTRDVLHEEITKEYIWWPLVPPPERARIFAEISDKYLQWPFAPT